MGAIFGSDSSSSSNTSVAPFAGNEDKVKKVWDAIYGNYGDRATPYNGKLSADINSNITNAVGGFANSANNQVLNDYASGKYIDPANNPYAKSGLALGTESLMKNFGKLNDSIKTGYNSRGFYNSSMKNNSQQRAVQDTQKALGDYTSNYMGNLYNKGVSDMLSANTSQQNNYGNLLNAGNSLQNLQQSGLDKQYQEFLRQQGVDSNNLNTLVNFLSAIKSNSSTTSTTQHTPGLLGK